MSSSKRSTVIVEQLRKQQMLEACQEGKDWMGAILNRTEILKSR